MKYYKKFQLIKESMDTFAKLMEEFNSYQYVGYLTKLSSYVDTMIKTSEILDSDLKTNFIKQCSDILSSNVTEAEYSRKKMTEILKNLDSINKKVEKAETSKAKNLGDLQNEQEEIKSKKENIEKQTLSTLKDVNIRNEIQFIESMKGFETSYTYFYQNLTLSTSKLKDSTQKYTTYSSKKKNLFESGQSVEGFTVKSLKNQEAPKVIGMFLKIKKN